MSTQETGTGLSHYDPTLQEAMSADQLQQLLRDPGGPGGPNLREAHVTIPRPLAPWMFLVSGALLVYGQHFFWEVEVDIRTIEKAEHLIAFCNKLNQSFDEAAEKASKGTAVPDTVQ
jgi:hypothetical protein